MFDILNINSAILLSLMKELEKKKKLQGVKTEVKLTKKQQEVMAAQLAKESEIRAKTKQVRI